MELATREGEAAAAPPRSAPCSRPNNAPPSSSTALAWHTWCPQAQTGRLRTSFVEASAVMRRTLLADWSLKSCDVTGRQPMACS
ncbi:unnamed protein product [Colias eurytheme]|nr:unnamed protein product [Colias eurytheme]